MRGLLHLQDLAQLVCPNPDCVGEHPVYIQAKCHRDAGVEISFDPDRRVLMVQCHECKTPICDIAVAAAITH